MKAKLSGISKEVASLEKAARRANIDSGFKYMKLCQPRLIIEIITKLKAVSTSPDPDMVQVEALAQATAGKHGGSSEGIAFYEACKPELVSGWCQKFFLV